MSLIWTKISGIRPLFAAFLIATMVILASCAPKQRGGNILNEGRSANPETPMHPTREGHRTAVAVEEQVDGSFAATWPSNDIRIEDVSLREVRYEGNEAVVKMVYLYREKPVEITLRGLLKKEDGSESRGENRNHSLIAFLYQVNPVRPKLLFGDLFCESSNNCANPVIEIFYRLPDGKLESVQVNARALGTPSEDQAPQESFLNVESDPVHQDVPVEEAEGEGHWHDHIHGESGEEDLAGRYTGIEIVDLHALAEIAELAVPSEDIVENVIVVEEDATTVERPPVPGPPNLDNIESAREEVRLAQGRTTRTEFLKQFEVWHENQNRPRIDSVGYRKNGRLDYSIQVSPSSCVRWRRESDSHQLWIASITEYTLLYLSSTFCPATNDADLVINVASKENGGRYCWRVNGGTKCATNHQTGLDLDIRYPRSGGTPGGSVVSGRGEMITENNIRENTWNLYKTLYETGALHRLTMHRSISEAIESTAASKGESELFDKVKLLIEEREYDHKDHLHVQLLCSQLNPQCQDPKLGE